MKIEGNSEFYDPEWIKVITDSLLDINIDKFSDNKKKMLRELYFDNIREGLNPKEAMKKRYGSIKIIRCFEAFRKNGFPHIH